MKQKFPKSENKAFHFQTDDHLGILTIDVPHEKVNILSATVMDELENVLDEIKASTDLRTLIIISGKDNNFIAGANIQEIENITTPSEGAKIATKGQAVFNKIANLPVTTIAAIHGACVGGGLELALACNFRIAYDSPQTLIGLPEVRLGIIPGFGGTQRLPRLIGIQRALDYILTGKLVHTKDAYHSGIIDRVVSKEFTPDLLASIATAFSVELQSPEIRRKIKSRRKRANAQDILLEKNFVGRKILFDQARKRAKAKSKGHYPAPELAIDAVEKGLPLDLRAGLAIEARLLGRAIAGNVSKNMIKNFYLLETIKKDKGVTDYPGKVQPIKRIGLIGAGVMGGGIAQYMAYKNLPVRMKDINYDAIAKGTAVAAKVFTSGVKKRRLTSKEMHNKMALISGTTDFSGFDHVDLIIEAIVEDIDIKKKVFAELDQVAPQHTIFVSNTSSLSIKAMAQATRRPEKTAGLHFFNPVHRMPLIEVIRTDATSEETIASLVAFTKFLGKNPIVVKDSPGFLVNRLLSVYMAEAARMLHEGPSIEEIDNALLDFGMPMGPFRLMDEVGISVASKVSKVMGQAFGERMQEDDALDKLLKQGRLGIMNNKGFYRYTIKEQEVDPSIYELLGLFPETGTKTKMNEIQERTIFLMINEAAMCLSEKLIRRPHDVDAGMIFGAGFPPFRGGLLRYADELSSNFIVDRLLHYTNKLGDRFKPAELLVEMSSRNKKFYVS